MSSSTSMVYGYGFIIKVSDETLEAFILNHKDSALAVNEKAVKNVLNVIEDRRINKRVGEFFEPLKKIFDYEYEAKMPSDGSFYAIVAEIMYQETGIRFDCRTDDLYNRGDAILFSAAMPWDFNEAELKLTSSDALDAIMKPYKDELGITADSEPLCFEYFS